MNEFAKAADFWHSETQHITDRRKPLAHAYAV